MKRRGESEETKGGDSIPMVEKRSLRKKIVATGSSAGTLEPCKFSSCVDLFEGIQTPFDSSTDFSQRTIPLKRALSLNEFEEDSWISSSFIDLILTKFGKNYNKVRYLSVEFAHYLSLKESKTIFDVVDITGSKINIADTTRPLVMILNAAKIHWNMIRVVRSPVPELQLFEPMGMPKNRHGGLNFRNVPRSLIDWLDACCPLPQSRSWISVGVSAIVSQQQITSYDCGVACLLYAEKCGLGEVI